jgi:two-component system, NarL family, nitrate/nitrite response regulator NarL
MILIGKADNCRDALAQANHKPDVIVVDINIGGLSGLEMLPELIRRSKGRVLVHTDFCDARLCEDAFLLGAMGIVPKGEPAGVIVKAIEHIHKGQFWDIQRQSALDAERRDVRYKGSPTTKADIALTLSERRLVSDLVTQWSIRYQSCDLSMHGKDVNIDELVSLYTKLGLRNRAELFIFAMRHGLTV